jgi:GntR family transcriptional regulator
MVAIVCPILDDGRAGDDCPNGPSAPDPWRIAGRSGAAVIAGARTPPDREYDPGMTGTLGAPRQIDRRSLVPYHHQLREILLGLLEGELRPGDKLPSEGELGETYGVSRTVVRQTLGELSREGRIYKVKGKGAFVSDRRLVATFAQRAAGLHEEMTHAGHAVSSRTLTQRVVPAPVRIAAELELGVGQPVVQLDRLRAIDAEPIQVVRTFLPAALMPGFEDEDMTDRSLYALLRERWGVRPDHGRRSIRTGPASAEDATLLEIREGAPVLLVESLTRTADDVPFEYFVATYRGDRMQFDIEVVS